MSLVELQIHSHHLLLALLAVPVLWGANYWYQSWKITKANQRYARLCREGHEIQRLESFRRAKGLQTGQGPSGPKHRAYAANFKL